MTVLSATRARIKLLPVEKQKSLEAELALLVARQMQKQPVASLAKVLMILMDLLEDDKASEQGDGLDEFADNVRRLFAPTADAG